VEHRGRDRYAVTQVGPELDQLLLAQRPDGLVLAVDLLERVLQRPGVALAVVSVDRLADPRSEAGAGPAEMGFQDLADVHSAGNAPRVEHDVALRAALEERHVLARHDLRPPALFAVAAGHFVAGLDLALPRHEHLDHLHHARRQLIAAL